MQEQHIDTKFFVYQYNELPEVFQQLIDKAKEQVTKSYAPYSNFKVGAAALLANGQIFTGSNQENAAYPSGLCAERTTLFYANAQCPDVAVKALAIAAYANGDFLDEPISPCGSCRQVMLETEKRFNEDMQIILYGRKAVYVLVSAKSMLPFSFVKESLMQ